MAVYVDNSKIRIGVRRRSRLTADTIDELLEFADELELKHRRFGKAPGWFCRYYAVTARQRRRAIKLGAKPETPVEAAHRVVGPAVREALREADALPDGEISVKCSYCSKRVTNPCTSRENAKFCQWIIG